jgi:uncharacterized protein (TIGR00730 family)
VRICVFCGSSTGNGTVYAEAATALGTMLARRGIGLVYGGASVGTMGLLADAVLAAGGEAIGVIPSQLADREIAHAGLTELHVVADMHERKARMSELADGFLALPGGAGTLEELFEVWTWAQLGLHGKPIGLVDVEGYYQPLLRFVEHMVTAGFLRTTYRDMIMVDPNAGVLLDGFADYRPPNDKWANGNGNGKGNDLSEAVVGHGNGQSAAEPVDVLAWLLVRDGKLLNVRTTGKKFFYLPGGKREPGESDPVGLAREIGEELGVRIDQRSIRLFDLVTDEADGFANGRLVRMACYFAEYEGELTPGREIAELDWVGLEDASRCAPAGRQVLSRLAERGLLR